MRDETKEHTKQLEAAHEAMEQYRAALSVLAGTSTVEASEEFQRQLEIARERMEKYKTVYRSLAK